MGRIIHEYSTIDQHFGIGLRFTGAPFGPEVCYGSVMAHVELSAPGEVPSSRQASVRIGRHRYVRAPKPIHFPSEESLEDAVSETKRHLEIRTTLYLLMKDALAGHAIGSDQFVYWDPRDPQKCLSPDVFVKRGTTDALFDTWKVWERGAPELAVEVVSASDRRDSDWDEKMERYEASGIAEVVRFDPMNAEAPIRAWDRFEGELLERSPDSSDLCECATLGMWWVVVPSAFGPQLRLARDREGKELLPTPDEERMTLAAQLAEERRAHAHSQHARLLAEHAREAAEQAREAEARQREAAEHAREAAEQAREAAEHAREVAEQKLQAEAEARQREAEALLTIQREHDAALAELAKLRAERDEMSKKT